MAKYTVQPIAPDGTASERVEVSAENSDEAAFLVTGLTLKRGRHGVRGTLRAKVYFVFEGVVTMRRYLQSEA